MVGKVSNEAISDSDGNRLEKNFYPNLDTFFSFNILLVNY